MSAKLEKLLTLLTDGQWHDANCIMTMLEIKEDELRKTITLLAEAGLVEHDSATNQMKLDNVWKSFLANQKETDSKTHQSTGNPTVSTIIVPATEDTCNSMHTCNEFCGKQPKIVNSQRQQNKKNNS